MPNRPSIPVSEECISAFNELRSGPEATRPKFIICKISDDNKSIVLEETSTEKDWHFFRMKLCAAVDKDGGLAPRYAIYDMDYGFGSKGKQTMTVFIEWSPSCVPLKKILLYLNNRQQLTSPFDLKVSIEADCIMDLEWAAVMEQVREDVSELSMGK
ncbi:hypothetical protein N7516_000089 [Penicillium verrucosum]|uniref:uncharacterized protein n=1 Tax=Penicillium verrucosum TaxID=60171 RepID=UPI002544D5DA|nr:uncharacterized protein N7516_000089 [Penicillium verrucosum]KAJ5939921.1 hypothetical protein N7516_000089 [Penicillium verrucosum]